MAWASENVKPGDTIKIRILDSDKPDAPKHSQPAATKVEAEASREKSRRYYLALYKRQRKQLDREIRFLATACPEIEADFAKSVAASHLSRGKNAGPAGHTGAIAAWSQATVIRPRLLFVASPTRG